MSETTRIDDIVIDLTVAAATDAALGACETCKHPSCAGKRQDARDTQAAGQELATYIAGLRAQLTEAQQQRDALVEKVANQDRAWTVAYEAGMQWRHRAEAAEARLAEIDAMRNERLDVVATITKQRDALAAELAAVLDVLRVPVAEACEYEGGVDASFHVRVDALNVLRRALAAQEGADGR